MCTTFIRQLDIIRSMTVVEIMDFRLRTGANKKQYVKEAERIVKEFTSQQPGFITAKLAESKGVFTWIIEWETAKDAKATAKAFQKRKDMSVFKKYIDESSVKARYTTLVKKL